MESNPRIDPAALAAHAGWMGELARHLLRDPDAAADVVQEASIAALRRSPAPGFALEPWLSRVVRNLALRRRRSELRRADHELQTASPSESPSPTETLERIELQRAVIDAVSSVPEPFRTVLVQRYFEERSSADIARLLGVPAGTVRWRLSRGLEELRGKLDSRLGGRELWSLAFAPIAWPSATGAGAGAATTGASSSIPSTILKGALAMSAGKLAAVLIGASALAVSAWWLTGSRPEAVDSGRGDHAASSNAAIASVAFEPRASDTPVELAASRAAVVAAPEPAPATPATTLEAARRVARFDARFVDPDGAPWADVRVRVRAPLLRFAFDPDPSVASGRDGRLEVEFEFPELPFAALENRNEWSFEIVATRAGCTLHKQSAVLHVGETTHLGDVVLTNGVRVLGVVFGADGHAVAGARVGVLVGEPTERAARVRLEGSERFDDEFAATTDAAGAFLLDGVAPGSQRFWAGAPGMRFTWTSPLEVPAGRDLADVRLVLEPLADVDTIEGRIVDADDRPASASLYCAFKGADREWQRMADVDEQGRFTIFVEQNPAVCELSAIGMAVDGKTMRRSVRDVKPGTRGLVIRFDREPRPAIAVRVRDPKGAPIDDARFMLTADAFADDPDPIRIAPGDFELEAADSPWSLDISAPGFRTASRGPYAPGAGPSELEVVLEPALRLRGRVVAAGQPIAGARIEACEDVSESGMLVNGFRCRLSRFPRAKAQSDARGEFEIDCDFDGEFWLRATADGWADGELGPIHTGAFDGGDSGARVELELTRGGAIEGRVVLADDADAEGFIVAINHGDGRARTQRAGPGGRYRFEGLAPGDWQVLASEREVDPGTTRYSSLTGRAPIEWDCVVTAGATTRFDLDLRLR
jgi:RNA polymerase sigma-70 factor (ECF subfamily)